MANGHGGRRPGAGRKPKLSTEIRTRALREANGDAEFALGLLVAVLRDNKVDLGLRWAAGIEIMDRVWGKARQGVDVNASLNAELGDAAASRFDQLLSRLIAARSSAGNSSGQASGGSDQ